MRKAIAAYIPPNADELKALFDSACFAFDTCALLDLYRISKEAREAFFQAMESVKERVWMPRHVAEEFMKDRREPIIYACEYYKSLEERVNEFEKSFARSLKSTTDEFQNNVKTTQEGRKKCPPLDMVTDIRTFKEAVNEKQKAFLEEARKKIAQFRDENLAVDNPLVDLEKDEVLQRLLSLFDEKVGAGFSPEEIRKIEKEGAERFQKKIPPGY